MKETEEVLNKVVEKEIDEDFYTKEVLKKLKKKIRRLKESDLNLKEKLELTPVISTT